MFSATVHLKSNRSSPPEVFSGKDVLKICSNFIGEHPYRNVISIKSQNNFIEITLRLECMANIQCQNLLNELIHLANKIK